MYEITYTSKTKPTDLPEGAEVKKVPTLPLSIRLDDGEELNLYKDGSILVSHREDMVSMSRLPKDKARKLIDGLLEYVGEPSLAELIADSMRGRAIKMGDTVQLSEEGRRVWHKWPDTGHVIRVDSDCVAGLPYRVDFGPGYGQVWVRAVEIERAHG